MTAQAQQQPSSSSPVWDQTALLAALASSGAQQQQPPSSTDWLLDTSASTHMSNTSGTLINPLPVLSPSSITVGNGARLPVTHAASTSIPTSSSSLLLNNVLVSPSLVHNLISVHKLTRDNNVSIEFDPHGFLLFRPSWPD